MYPWDRHLSHPDSPGQSWTAGPGGSQTRAGGQHEGADTKRGWTLPRRGVYIGSHPTPTDTTSARGDQHKGHLLFKAFGPRAAGFVRGGVLQLPSPAPGPGTKAATTPPPRAHPRRPRVPRGGGDPRRPQRAAPPPGAHLKRGESLMHSSNSTVMAAAARGAHWHEDRGARSGIPGRPARPSAGPPAPRSAPARPGLRPPRRRPAPPVTAGECRQSPPPARAAGCHGRGASPMFAARARLPLSRPGSVAKRLPAARPRLARARTPRRPAL